MELWSSEFEFEISDAAIKECFMSGLYLKGVLCVRVQTIFILYAMDTHVDIKCLFEWLSSITAYIIILGTSVLREFLVKLCR